MKIGIDIDDTLIDSCDIVEEYAYKYSNQYGNENIIKNNIDKILRGNFKEKEIIDFFSDYAREMGEKQQVKENAKEIIDKLKEEGNQIYIITARSNKFYKDVNKYVKDFLDKNNIYYDKIITSCSYKVDVCKSENIDIMFDDAIDTCESLVENGIDAVVFNSRINSNKSTKCKRVNNWNEVYNYIKNCKLEIYN